MALTVPSCCQLGTKHAGAHSATSLAILLDGIPSQGLCWLEAERWPSVGAPYPLLVLPPGCDAAAAELVTILQRMNLQHLQKGWACDDAEPPHQVTVGCMEGLVPCSALEAVAPLPVCERKEEKGVPRALGAPALPWSMWAPSARGLLADLGLVVRSRSSSSLPQCWESTLHRLMGFAAAQQLPAVTAMLEGFL